MIEKLNLRVYGLLLNNNGEVLLTDESRFGMEFTKFPGGGIELGEGISDCLKREFIEECCRHNIKKKTGYCKTQKMKPRRIEHKVNYRSNNANNRYRAKLTNPPSCNNQYPKPQDVTKKRNMKKLEKDRR